MPVLPCQSLGLCKKMQEIIGYTAEKTSKHAKKYGIIALIVIELLSLILSNYYQSEYINYFPTLVNISFVNIGYYIYTNRRLLKLCKIATIAIRFLIAYFLFNLFAGIFKIQNYYYIVAIGLISASFVLMFISLFSNKKK